MKRRWTETEKEHLKAHYHAIGAKELSKLVERTPRAIVDQAGRMNLRKCQERLAEQGRENVLKRWYPPVIET